MDSRVAERLSVHDRELILLQAVIESLAGDLGRRLSGVDDRLGSLEEGADVIAVSVSAMGARVAQLVAAHGRELDSMHALLESLSGDLGRRVGGFDARLDSLQAAVVSLGARPREAICEELIAKADGSEMTRDMTMSEFILVAADVRTRHTPLRQLSPQPFMLTDGLPWDSATPGTLIEVGCFVRVSPGAGIHNDWHFVGRTVSQYSSCLWCVDLGADYANNFVIDFQHLHRIHVDLNVPGVIDVFLRSHLLQGRNISRSLGADRQPCSL